RLKAENERLSLENAALAQEKVKLEDEVRRLQKELDGARTASAREGLNNPITDEGNAAAILDIKLADFLRLKKEDRDVILKIERRVRNTTLHQDALNQHPDPAYKRFVERRYGRGMELKDINNAIDLLNAIK
ncbi:MAG: hypothetical protein HQK53_19530, partial [Oligoflexia bacterium]|nr:hypothetical protein [Oligoflexia bacterium]